MADLDKAAIEHYRNSFLREVEQQVEEGEWIKMCMQCGVCSGSCPLGPHWEHPPQEIFMMIRAGKRDEVLSSTSMWMCTSCYNCIVRCPREIPITHVMHGLATYADKLGLAPKQQPTRKFSHLFWSNAIKTGRVNEAKLGISLYFMNGIVEGIKTSLKMAPIGLNLLKTRRFNPWAFTGGHKGCKGAKDIHKIIKKAEELERKRLSGTASG
ncbi:MAG: 4Fe-4S dicluster domain-containing protein [Gammaproteobacteria bacterium]|nr:4Fe-4S dicluster domain-containing protein [Gammaproteobacteria bacterium]NIU05493.1 4Fe-4S dicluster domain-containing protein [Gammaproteobacteria bacterium]NIV52639.1 4Fe-4S dicluster domain-containing protein [Gammaproteobacteria bacterium]NIX86766.1 4Fe-4S dicluster domain-containing protein [Gammaproteobacteria bacterium]